MPANTSPIFPLTAKTTWVNAAGLTANTTTDLTSGTNYPSGYTAGANGSRVDFVRARALGTNVQTCLRVWINNGLTTATAANNTLFYEASFASTTVSQSSAQVDNIIPINVSLPSGYVIYFTFGTAVAAGYDLITVGGDY
jgi:hypothetical protein